MKTPVGWLREFTSIEIPVQELCDKMTLSGSKVESLEDPGETIQNVLTGRITSIRPHPGADRLQICVLDIGGDAGLQIVTAAANIAEGQVVPVVLDGGVLADGTVISKGELRGELSDGMLCSFQELGLEQEDLPGADPDGILILDPDTPVGRKIQKVLGMDDLVIDFEITSNRPDCFSMEGIAREAAITTGETFKLLTPSPFDTMGPASSELASVHIENPELCSRYVGRVVHNVSIGPSPDWMRQRLRLAGMRPVNNIVDITNYVMLESGQPMHAFDLDRLSGGKVYVRFAETGEKLRTLDGEDRELDADMAVIADESGAVAVAGVMGGEMSEIQDNTATLLLEAACFEPVRVRMGAKRLGMRTEASSRFEKGLDPLNCMRAMDRACELITMLGCGVPAPDAIEDWPVKPDARSIAFDPARINALLGTDIPVSEMNGIIRSIGCVMSETDSKGVSKVEPPSWRPDLVSYADLAEEVARFYGYNNIPATLLSGKEMTAGGRSDIQKLRESVKDILIAQGFFECCTYSFESPKVYDMMRLDEADPLRNAVRIRNPLGEDYSVMRTSMFPSMTHIAAINWNRSVAEASLFEIGFVYLPDSLPVEKLPDERRMLAGCLYAKEDDGDSLYLRMKGAVEFVAARLGAQMLDFQVPDKSAFPYLHPGKSATIGLNGETIGHIGYIHPLVARSLELPESTVYLETDLEALLAEAGNRPAIRPLPKFPSISRDLAVQVGRDVLAGDLVALIRTSGGDYLESVSLFDVYEGRQVGEGQKSLAFSLVFQAGDRTLTDDEISGSMTAVMNALESAYQAKRR